jgi:hypothetical protein
MLTSRSACLAPYQRFTCSISTMGISMTDVTAASGLGPTAMWMFPDMIIS